jgi:catechol 2,3-dioxygenase-like lactoylglutathione lyase family enzyme
MRGRTNRGPDTDRWERKDWWGVTLEAPDPRELLAFWSEVLGVPIHGVDDTGGTLDFGEGVGSFAVQKAEVYEPPVWPPEPGKQGMQMHIEVEVTDLGAAVAHAIELGATEAAHQPQDDVRVMLDPAGHPFCLYT